MNQKCRECGIITITDIDGIFCSNSCKKNYRNRYKRELYKLYREFNRKFK